MLKQTIALLAVAAVSVACSQTPSTEPVADKIIGADCSLESRAQRAEMLTDLVARTYGPADLEGLHDATAQMERAGTDGEMEAAARVYRLRFAIYMSEKARTDLRAFQRESWAQIFDDLKERTPELAAGLIEIRAEMARLCPGA